MGPIKKLTYSGLLAALVMIATALIKVPSPLGYIHLGDGVIYLSSALLGPSGALASAVGSALADLLTGYSLYAPVTFIIKGMMGFLCGLFLHRSKRSTLAILLVLAALEALMVLGYFGLESTLYGFEAALPAAGFNCIQGAAGVLFGLFAIRIIQR